MIIRKNPRAEIESQTLRHDQQRDRERDDELARLLTLGMWAGSRWAGPFPYIHSFHSLFVLLCFPRMGVIDARPFSCPVIRNFPSVAVRPIPTPIFANVLITAKPRQGFLQTYNISLCGKGNLFGDRDGILLCQICMGWICQHCGAPTSVDLPYRVKSEESARAF